MTCPHLRPSICCIRWTLGSRARPDAFKSVTSACSVHVQSVARIASPMLKDWGVVCAVFMTFMIEFAVNGALTIFSVCSRCLMVSVGICRLQRSGRLGILKETCLAQTTVSHNSTSKTLGQAVPVLLSPALRFSGLCALPILLMFSGILAQACDKRREMCD